MTNTIHVYDPTGHARVEALSLAALPASLEGLRPGIVENRKANARLLMETMIEGVREQIPLGELTVIQKPTAGPPSKRNERAIVESCDFVLVGSSD